MGHRDNTITELKITFDRTESYLKKKFDLSKGNQEQTNKWQMAKFGVRKLACACF
jgi:hypothetical protein